MALGMSIGFVTTDLHLKYCRNRIGNEYRFYNQWFIASGMNIGFVTTDLHSTYCSISNVNQWLQTLCSSPMLLPHSFACKAMVRNRMFVLKTISDVFRMYISCYKSNVRSQSDFCSISHVNQWLQTLCSFPIRFLQYFASIAEVTNPMFVPNAISHVNPLCESAVFRM